jgi:acetyl esterase
MKMHPIVKCKYGPLNPKVDLLPDFFSNFDASIRDEILKEEAKFYKELTKPYSIGERININDIQYKTKDGTQIPLRIYEPRISDFSFPPIMFFHGGGFITCSVETHNFLPSFIAYNANAIVFSVDYRLAPEYKFPIGLEDCYEAILWIKENNKKFNIDFSKLMVCGDSSGGNFAAVVCLMARDRKEFEIVKQILIYPVTDLSGTVDKKSVEIYTPTNEDRKKGVDYISLYTKSSDNLSNPYLSPLVAEDLTRLPPALFIQAECDSLLDDGLMYAQRLQDASVKVEYKIYKGMPHAFILRTYEETFDALEYICNFITY